jgi:hypothetical protein
VNVITAATSVVSYGRGSQPQGDMMPDESKDDIHVSAFSGSDLRSQLDRISAENLVLKQRLEFSDLFAKQEKVQADQFAAHKKYVEDTITKRLVALSAVGIVLLAVAWYQTVTPVRRNVQERLDKEFASDNIRALISDAAQKAASDQAKKLIETKIKPVTERALIDIQQHRDEVSNIADHLKQDTHNTVNQMQAEVSAKLAKDETAFTEIHSEETKQLDDLKSIVSYQDKVKNIETKLAYVNGDRVRGVSIWMTNPDGSQGLTNEAIPTSSLVAVFMLNRNQDWRYRVRAAQLLGSRREVEVPPALIASMSNDSNLWVRRAALASFQQLCGFQANDAFGFQEAAEWWDKDKAQFIATIPKK